MEHLRMSREKFQTFYDVLCSFKNSVDPDRAPGDHENCPAGFPDNNISHKKKLLTFLSDASPPIVSRPNPNQSSIFPNLTLSIQNNDSYDFLAKTSSEINHPSITLELKPMNTGFAEVDDEHQTKTGIMNKTKNTCLSKWKRRPNMPDVIKGHWTLEEDRLLEHVVKNCGVQKWARVAKWLYGRDGKQCRERWHNHLRPDIKKGTWSEEEEHVLVNAHRQFGNKWAKIANTLPGRSENTIKNHYNTTKRKVLTLRKTNSNSPLQSYIRSLISSNTLSVKGRPHLGLTLQTPSGPKSPKYYFVKNKKVKDLLVPTQCSGRGHSSKGSTSSSEENTASMPKDLIYGLNPGKKNTRTEMSNAKKQSDSKKMVFLELL